MFKADDYRLKIKALEETVGEAKYALDIDSRYERLKELRAEQEKPEVWQDLERSAKIGREIASNEGKISAYEAGRKALDDANEIIDLIEETEEEELVPELDKMMAAAEKDIEDMRIRALLRGKYDSSNALLALHAGAGGTEACVWCAMLYRMYC
ncbi:MAG: PCRF domain-containing protein, partial [Clostridiales bacterium]|nr:PCRF domain-containing protein [Clostridiales bacterium]